MVELKPSTPTTRLLPVETAGVRMREVGFGPLTLVMPYRGRDEALAAALEAAHALDWPETGRMTGTTERGILWFGRAQALLIGLVPDDGLTAQAALVNQSDAWAVIEMQGDRAAGRWRGSRRWTCGPVCSGWGTPCGQRWGTWRPR